MKRTIATIPIHVIIPARNEASGIAHVLSDIEQCAKKMPGYTFSVSVINNGSEDDTALIAQEMGATVIHEPLKGKGQALRKGFIETPNASAYVVLIDGDHSHNAMEIPRLLEPLEANFADVIVGSRLQGNIINGAMSTSHRLANWLFTFLVRSLYQANITDTCSGFIAWKTPVLKKMSSQFTTNGFAIETEMITKTARAGYRIYSVPISNTLAKSDSKLSPLKDTARILYTIIKNRTWHIPQ